MFKKSTMINSHLNHFASSEEIDFQDIKVQKQLYTQPDIKSAKIINTKIANSTPGSSSTNGVCVDVGKVLLEAAKTGDSEKVQECVKNGAPFITDWVSFRES